MDLDNLKNKITTTFALIMLVLSKGELLAQGIADNDLNIKGIEQIEPVRNGVKEEVEIIIGDFFPDDAKSININDYSIEDLLTVLLLRLEGDLNKLEKQGKKGSKEYAKLNEEISTLNKKIKNLSGKDFGKYEKPMKEKAKEWLIKWEDALNSF